jgi:hypothetical protein
MDKERLERQEQDRTERQVDNERLERQQQDRTKEKDE